MPNYAITINSKFRPFEYNELVQPIIAATQAQYQLEDAYSEISSKASVWEKLANETTDPKAHATYKKFAEDLKARADDLSRNGLNPFSRKAFSDLRSRYSSDIIPIETAYKKRESQEQAQMQALMQNPTLIFSRRAGTTSLDDYIANPELGFDVTSGAMITQQVANIATKLSTLAKEGEAGKSKLRKILPYQYEKIEQRGFRPEEIQKAILKSPDADKILTSLVDEVLQASGMGSWKYLNEADKNNAMNLARQYANMGLYNAIGETKKDILQDTFSANVALENIKTANDIKKMNHQAALKERQNNNKPKVPGASNIPYTPVQLAASVNGDRKQIQDDLKFMKNLWGKGNDKVYGWQTLSKTEQRIRQEVPTSMGTHMTIYKTVPSERDEAFNRYKKIAQRYGINVGNSFGPGNFQIVMNRLEKENKKSIALSNGHTMNITSYKPIIDNIKANTNQYADNVGVVNSYNLDKGTTGSLVQNKTFQDALAQSTEQNLYTIPGVGIVLNLRKKDGSSSTYKLPPSVLSSSSDFEKSYNTIVNYSNIDPDSPYYNYATTGYNAAVHNALSTIYMDAITRAQIKSETSEKADYRGEVLQEILNNLSDEEIEMLGGMVE